MNKFRFYLIPFLFLSLFLPILPVFSQTVPHSSPIIIPCDSLEVYFSPDGGCTEAVVRELGKAKRQVLVQAYSFTSAPLAKALVGARKRGLDVRVILDKNQRSDTYSSADFLVHAGIPVKIDADHAIAHNKVMVIDSCVVITGSFNFTKSAEQNNAENLLVIRSKDLAAIYIENWWGHAAHSEPYVNKAWR